MGGDQCIGIVLRKRKLIMTDWTKPIYEQTSKKLAHFVGFSSDGAAVVEYCSNLYFINRENGTRREFRFINMEYKPISSRDKAISLIGQKIRQKDSDHITGIVQEILVRQGEFLFGITYGGSFIVQYFRPSAVLNYFVLFDTNEPIGELDC